MFGMDDNDDSPLQHLTFDGAQAFSQMFGGGGRGGGGGAAGNPKASNDAIVNALTAALCPCHMKLKKELSAAAKKNKSSNDDAENQNNSSITSTHQPPLLIEIGSLCSQHVLDNPSAFPEAELPVIDILPELYSSLIQAITQLVNLAKDNKPLPASDEDLSNALKTILKLLLLVGPGDDQRSINGLHLRPSLISSFVKLFGYTHFYDPEAFFLGVTFCSVDESLSGIGRSSIKGGSDAPAHQLGSVVASGLAPWPNPSEVLSGGNGSQSSSSSSSFFSKETLTTLQQLAKDEQELINVTSPASEDAAVPTSSTSNTTTAAVSSPKEERDKFLAVCSRNHAKFLLRFAQQDASAEESKKNAKFLTRARLMSLLLVDPTAESQNVVLGSAQGSFFRQWGPILTNFASNHVEDDFAVDVLDVWSRFSHVYAASHPALKPLDHILDHLGTEGLAPNTDHLNEKKTATSDDAAAESLPPSPLELTYNKRFTTLRLGYAAVQHAQNLFMSRNIPRGQSLNHGGQISLVQKLLRIMKSNPSFLSGKITKLFASVATDDAMDGMRFGGEPNNNNASRLARAIDAGLISTFASTIRTLAGDSEDLTLLAPRHIAPVVSCLGVMGMSVVNSQNANANPAQFLLEDTVLSQTILRMLSIPSIDRDVCSPKQAACFVQATSAVAVFANHNIRDMVPALNERGYVEAVFNALKSCPPQKYHWCVVSCIPLINTFAVHGCVKDMILENGELIVSTVKVLTFYSSLRRDNMWSRDYFELLKQLPNLRSAACDQVVVVLDEIMKQHDTLSQSGIYLEHKPEDNTDSADIQPKTQEQIVDDQRHLEQNFVRPFFGFCSFLSSGIQSVSHSSHHAGGMLAHFMNNHRRDQHQPAPELHLLTARSIGAKMYNILKRLFKLPSAISLSPPSLDDETGVAAAQIDTNNNNSAIRRRDQQHQQDQQQQNDRKFVGDLCQLLKTLEPSEFKHVWPAISSKAHECIGNIRSNLAKYHQKEAANAALLEQLTMSREDLSVSSPTSPLSPDTTFPPTAAGAAAASSSSAADPAFANEHKAIIPREDTRWLLFVLEICLALRDAGRGIDYISPFREKVMQSLIDVFFEVNAVYSARSAAKGSSSSRSAPTNNNNNNNNTQNQRRRVAEITENPFLDRVSNLLMPEDLNVTPPRGHTDMLDFLQLRANRHGNDFANHSLKVIFEQLQRLIVNNRPKLRQAQFCMKTAASILANATSSGPPPFLMSDDSLAKSLEQLIELDEEYDSAHSSLRNSEAFSDILRYGVEALRALSNYPRFVRSDRRKGCGRFVVKFFSSPHYEVYLKNCENLDRHILELFSNLSRDISAFEYPVTASVSSASPILSNNNNSSTRLYTSSRRNLGFGLPRTMTEANETSRNNNNSNDDDPLMMMLRDNDNDDLVPPNPMDSVPEMTLTPREQTHELFNLDGPNNNNNNNNTGSTGRRNRPNNVGGPQGTPIQELVRDGWSELQASIALEESAFNVEGARAWLRENNELNQASDLSVQRRRRPAAAADADAEDGTTNSNNNSAGTSPENLRRTLNQQQEEKEKQKQTPPMTPVELVRAKSVSWILSVLRAGRERLWNEKIQTDSDDTTVWNQDLSRIHAPATRAIFNLTRLLQDRCQVLSQLIDALIENPWRNLEAVQQISNLFTQAGMLAVRNALIKDTALVQIMLLILQHPNVDPESSKREQSALREMILNFLNSFVISGITRRPAHDHERHACEYFMRGFCWNGSRCILPHYEPRRPSQFTLDRNESQYVKDISTALSRRYTSLLEKFGNTTTASSVASKVKEMSAPAKLSNASLQDGICLLSTDIVSFILPASLVDLQNFFSSSADESSGNNEDLLLVLNSKKMKKFHREHFERVVSTSLNILNALAITSLSETQSKIYQASVSAINNNDTTNNYNNNNQDAAANNNSSSSSNKVKQLQTSALSTVFKYFLKLHLGDRLGKFLKLMLEDVESIKHRILHSMKKAIDSISNEDQEALNAQKDPEQYKNQSKKPRFSSWLTEGQVEKIVEEKSSKMISSLSKAATANNNEDASEEASSSSTNKDQAAGGSSSSSSFEIHKNIAVDLIEFLYELENVRQHYPTIYEETFQQYCYVLQRDNQTVIRVALLVPSSQQGKPITDAAGAGASSPSKHATPSLTGLANNTLSSSSNNNNNNNGNHNNNIDFTRFGEEVVYSLLWADQNSSLTNNANNEDAAAQQEDASNNTDDNNNTDNNNSADANNKNNNKKPHKGPHVPTFCSVLSHMLDIPPCALVVGKNIAKMINNVMSLEVHSVSSHLSAIVSLFSHVGSRFPGKLCIEMVNAAEKAFAEKKFIQVKRACEILALAASKQRSYESRLLHEISSRNVGRSIMKIISSPVPSKSTSSSGTADSFNPTEFIVSLEGLLDVLGANVAIRPNQHVMLEQSTHSTSSKMLKGTSPRTHPRPTPSSASSSAVLQQQGGTTTTNSSTQQHVDPLSLGSSAIDHQSSSTSNNNNNQMMGLPSQSTNSTTAMMPETSTNMMMTINPSGMVNTSFGGAGDDADAELRLDQEEENRMMRMNNNNNDDDDDNRNNNNVQVMNNHQQQQIIVPAGNQDDDDDDDEDDTEDDDDGEDDEEDDDDENNEDNNEDDDNDEGGDIERAQQADENAVIGMDDIVRFFLNSADDSSPLSNNGENENIFFGGGGGDGSPTTHHSIRIVHEGQGRDTFMEELLQSRIRSTLLRGRGGVEGGGRNRQVVPPPDSLYAELVEAANSNNNVAELENYPPPPQPARQPAVTSEDLLAATRQASAQNSPNAPSNTNNTATATATTNNADAATTANTTNTDNADPHAALLALFGAPPGTNANNNTTSNNNDNNTSTTTANVNNISTGSADIVIEDAVSPVQQQAQSPSASSANANAATATATANTNNNNDDAAATTVTAPTASNANNTSSNNNNNNNNNTVVIDDGPDDEANAQGPYPWDGALDPAFLGELPSDLRAEILRENFQIIRTVRRRRVPVATDATAAAGANGGEQQQQQRNTTTTRENTSRVHPVFLRAVPGDLQREILELERDIEDSEERQRQALIRDQQAVAGRSANNSTTRQQPETNANSNTTGNGTTAPSTTTNAAALAPTPAAEPSPAEFINSLPPDLRADVLREMDLTQLANDPALRDEAMRLRAPPPPPPPPPGRPSPTLQTGGDEDDESGARLRNLFGGIFSGRNRNGLFDDEDGISGSRGRRGHGGPGAGGMMMNVPLSQRPPPRSRRDHANRMSTGRHDPAPKLEEMHKKQSPVLFIGKSTVGETPIATVAEQLMPYIVLGRQVPMWLRKFFAALVHDPATALVIVKAMCKMISAPLTERDCALLHLWMPVHLAGGVFVGAPKPVGVVINVLQLFMNLIKSQWMFKNMCVRLVNSSASYLNGPFHVAQVVSSTTTAENSASASATSSTVLATKLNPTKEEREEIIKNEFTPAELKAAEENPLLLFLDAAQPWLTEPDVQQQFFIIFAHSLATLDKLKAVDQNTNSDPFPDPPGYAKSPEYNHPRHEHPLRWRDPARADPRYAHGKAYCNICTLEYDTMGYQCSACTYDLCPACAADDATIAVQELRSTRFFQALFMTSFPERLLGLLSKRCQPAFSDILLRWINQGVDAAILKGDINDAPWIRDAERSLIASAKEVVRGIDGALRKFRSDPESKVADSNITVQHASKILAHLSMPLTDSLISTTLLPLLIIHAKRGAHSGIELRRMWIAVGSYMTEVDRVLTSCKDRNSVTLPASAVPLVISFTQFHLYSAANNSNNGDDQPGSPSPTREISYSGATHMERTETELLLGEANEKSEVSETAIARLKQTSPTKPKLPQIVSRFLEKNRLLINACLHWTPSLLQGSFKFLSQSPRLVDFEFKQKEFRKEVNLLRRHAEQLDLSIARKNCFSESFNLIRARQPDQLRGPLHIRFREEEGADAGGLTREWFQILGEEIVNPNYGLFVPSSEGTTFQPNSLSDVNPDHLLFFKFVGRIIGLALLHDVPLDVHLTRAVYRHMVGIEPGLVDIQSIDPALYNSLQEILKLDLSEHDLYLFFAITMQKFDEMEEVELIPGGADIEVTNDNKKDYIRRRCAMRMTKLIEKQLIELLTGFYEIIPRHLITAFTEQELELLVCGMPDVDVEDLRVHTEYQGYSSSSPQIRWFWECVAGMSQQDRANLLQFTTGCSKVPPGGFANLSGAAGNRSMFSIMRVDCDTELLPVAHTCFNRIDLPPYPTSDVLRQKLMTAITLGSKGFALV